MSTFASTLFDAEHLVEQARNRKKARPEYPGNLASALARLILLLETLQGLSTDLAQDVLKAGEQPTARGTQDRLGAIREHFLSVARQLRAAESAVEQAMEQLNEVGKKTRDTEFRI
ncbi:hypothetical protein N8J89_12855 [Crossiella sp. CA-258035]|uniref:hypothetical protein n=1 Tax=Crossiella sp. CA-258035 TaxID=2981138 RepID=UPI0024BCBBAF|nr:hypothetical protein [Crossiella sp. CA-258035]WHT21910.1 hypothetical protein N8J89_12855 [Crossiella sp. CA-258035]